jgi:hypothetical protein
MLCNTTIIRYLNKPTQSKTQLTQEVVNSFNTYYTQTFSHYLLFLILATRTNISLYLIGNEISSLLLQKILGFNIERIITNILACII